MHADYYDDAATRVVCCRVMGRQALARQAAANDDPALAVAKALAVSNARSGRLVASPTTAEEWKVQFASARR